MPASNYTNWEQWALKWGISTKDPSWQQQVQQIVNDLRSLGIPEKFFGKVFFVDTIAEAKKIVGQSLRANEQVIAFGEPGSGKSQCITQAANELGRDVHTISLVTQAAEDLAGLPIGKTNKLDEPALRAYARKQILVERLDKVVDTEFEKEKLRTNFANPGFAKAKIRERFLNQVASTISQKDIDDRVAQLKSFSDDKDLLNNPTVQFQTIYVAPTWYYDIVNTYNETGRKSVLFLDEMNQADKQTIDAATDLLLEHRFAGNNKYYFGDAAVCCAAGNFYRNNTNIKPLPEQIFSRFQAIIYWPADYVGQAEYTASLYQPYGSQYPCLNHFLSAVFTENALAELRDRFPDGRDLTKFVAKLALLEDESRASKKDEQGISDSDWFAEIDSLRDIGWQERLDLVGGIIRTPKSEVARALVQFLTELGVPYFVEHQLTQQKKNELVANKDKTVAFVRNLSKFLACAFPVSPAQPRSYTYKGPSGNTVTFDPEEKNVVALYRQLVKDYGGIQGVTLEGLSSVSLAYYDGDRGINVIDLLKKNGLSPSELPTK